MKESIKSEEPDFSNPLDTLNNAFGGIQTFSGSGIFFLDPDFFPRIRIFFPDIRKILKNPENIGISGKNPNTPDTFPDVQITCMQQQRSYLYLFSLQIGMIRYRYLSEKSEFVSDLYPEYPGKIIFFPTFSGYLEKIRILGKKSGY